MYVRIHILTIDYLECNNGFLCCRVLAEMAISHRISHRGYSGQDAVQVGGQGSCPLHSEFFLLLLNTFLKPSRLQSLGTCTIGQVHLLIVCMLYKCTYVRIGNELQFSLFVSINELQTTYFTTEHKIQKLKEGIIKSGRK